jgi:peptide/nickel transport system substrate-binding protein
MAKDRRLPSIAIVVALGLVASACGGDDESSDPGPDGGTEAPDAPAPQTGGTLAVGLEAEIDNFLPANGRWSPSGLMVAKAVYDPLAAMDAEGVPRPYLAESIDPDDTFTTWTITLREGISFHDGTPLDAAALKANLDKVIASALTSSVFGPVDTDRPDGGVEITGDLEVTVHLETAWAHLPVVLTNQTGFIVSPAQYEAGDGAEHPVGTGPFVFESWERDREVRVDRNDAYWQTDADGNALPYLTEITFATAPDATSRLDGLQAGDFNLIHTQAANQIIDLDQDGPPEGTRVLIDESEGTEANVMFNSETGAFSDVRLRRAASHALDREVLVRDLFEGYFTVADGPFREESGFGTIENLPEFDLEAAKAEVESWKADNGGASPQVTLTVLPSPENTIMGQYISEQWQAAGIETTLSTVDETAGTAAMVNGTFEAVLWSFWDRADPDALYHYIHGDSFLNFPNYYSDATDNALDEGRGITDPALRKAAYEKMWNDWGENAPILWLYHSTWAVAFADNVWGVGEFTLPSGERALPINYGQTWLTGVYIAD